ncbi:hypothetical protein QP948_04550 [Corynebacterium bovis]|uniref:hypothetical protein n=1 Tax=Corynebacterium bovis TaxID=36808 RepID=UPI00254EE0DD|nr:hypothetical protein [Corynebacterium bovis]MDK8510675.1 hypothetical protein [Corynebacterium bovis]
MTRHHPPQTTRQTTRHTTRRTTPTRPAGPSHPPGGPTGDPASRTRERCAAVLRHPRSRARLTPDWRPPAVRLTHEGLPVTVTAARRQVSSAMWESLTGSTAAADEALFVVTLTGEVTVPAAGTGRARRPTGRSSAVRTAGPFITSLFRRLTSGSPRTELLTDHRRGARGTVHRWTYTALVRERDLGGPAAPVGAPAEVPSGPACGGTAGRPRHAA